MVVSGSFKQGLINLAGATEQGTADQRQEIAENMAQSLYLKLETDRRTNGVTMQAQ